MGQTVIELIENSEGRQELWQWDLGRKVRVIPAEGITVDEVHFGNVFSGEALVVEPKVDETTGDIVANVPNILITQFFRINVYAVMVVPDGKITTERIMLDVEAREKPSDYVYTETEIKNYDALEKRIEELEKNGGGSGKPGADGFSPIASVEQTEDGAEITITDKNGTTKATVKNGKDGKDAADGKDGLNGKDGADGKTAYQYAQDGGYAGTEAEFAQKLAAENITVDSELSKESENPVQNKVVSEKLGELSEDIADLKENGSGTGSGLTAEMVTALDNMFKKCVFTGDITAEYEAFKTAFGIGGSTEPDIPVEPDVPEDVTLTSISATYIGGEVAVGTELTDLIGITVTATYSDGSTANVTGYTLSGTIAEGNNTITVSYNGKTTTFTVMGVVENEEPEVTTLYQIQNKVCNADFYEEIGLTFGSDTANGVANAWTLVAKGTTTDGGPKCLFGTTTDCGVKWTNASSSSTVTIAGEIIRDLYSIKQEPPIVITHEAGDGVGATLHYIDNTGVKRSVYCGDDSTEKRNYLNKMWGNTPNVVVGGSKGSAQFVGTILDFAIYMNKVYTEEEINAYLGV